MAIQIRSGAYEDYDAEKMVRGELALVISGDPDAEEGRSVKVAFDPDDDDTFVLKSENDAALDGKVDKVEGKGLSTEDYTTDEKDKLAGIEAGAEVNVNPDWDATSGDGEILNKPTTIEGYGITDAYTKAEIDESVDELQTTDSQLGTGLQSANNRIDQIIALEPGSTTGDAELQDIRVGADGETYNTAGTAVRTQLEHKCGIFHQTTMPTATYLMAGDTWFDTDNGNQMWHTQGSYFATDENGNQLTDENGNQLKFATWTKDLFGPDALDTQTLLASLLETIGELQTALAGLDERVTALEDEEETEPSE